MRERGKEAVSELASGSDWAIGEAEAGRAAEMAGAGLEL